MTCIGYKWQYKKNKKQHHIQNKSIFLPWYLINGLKCTVENILMPLNTLSELHMKSFMKMTISVGRCLKRYIKKILQFALTIYRFQRKTPKCKYWFLKVLCLETQMVCSGWLKNDSLCLHL